MARHASCLVLLLAIGACVESSPEGRVECIYSSSNQERTGTYSFQIEDIPIEYCTHIIYEHISFERSTMTIMPSNPEYDFIQNGWEKFIDLKKANPKLKLLIRIQRAVDFIGTAENRTEFIDEVVGFVEHYKFDGVSIEWFGYGNGEAEEDGPLYTFFEELRRSFEAAGHSEWEANIMTTIQEKDLDYVRICQVADSVSLMGFFQRAHDRNYLLAPLNNSNYAINTIHLQDVSIAHSLQKWLNDGCPPSKIILGVPFWGVTFTLQDPAKNRLDATIRDHGKTCPVTAKEGGCAYFELCQVFNETGWTFKWDEDGACPYAFQGDQWVSYENPASIEQKAAFARAKGLAGVFGFETGYDDYRGICGGKYPLTKALWKGFYSKSTP